MADTLDRTGAGQAGDRSVRRRRSRMAALAAVLITLLVALVVGGVYWHRSAAYAAPRFAGYDGPQPGRPDHVAVGDESTVGYHMLGPTGTTQYFEWGLINDGDRDVTITGADFISSPAFLHSRVLDRLSWSPYRADPAKLVNGLPEPSRGFPATLRAHGQINIRLRITKPPCDSVPAGGWLGVSQDIRLHWKALISSHTTQVGPTDTVALCG